jgi:hypothetical protein
MRIDRIRPAGAAAPSKYRQHDEDLFHADR